MTLFIDLVMYVNVNMYKFIRVSTITPCLFVSFILFNLGEITI